MLEARHKDTAKPKHCKSTAGLKRYCLFSRSRHSSLFSFHCLYLHSDSFLSHDLHYFYLLCVVGLLVVALSFLICTVLARLKKVFDILLSDIEFRAIRDQLGSRQCIRCQGHKRAEYEGERNQAGRALMLPPSSTQCCMPGKRAGPPSNDARCL